MPVPPSPSRAEVVAEAALRVLADRGARGLTHRAVDHEASLPEGSSSNVYRSRSALLTAAGLRLVATDLQKLRGVTDALPGGPVEPDIGAELLAGVIEEWTTGAAHLTLARFELLLEAYRNPALADSLASARRAMVDLTVELLPRVGCPDPAAWAVPTVAFVDGLLSNQLLSATRLDRAGLQAALRGWLMTWPSGRG